MEVRFLEIKWVFRRDGKIESLGKFEVVFKVGVVLKGEFI